MGAAATRSSIARIRKSPSPILATVESATGLLVALNGTEVEFLGYGWNRGHCSVRVPQTAPLYPGKTITIVSRWLTGLEPETVPEPERCPLCGQEVTP